MKKISRKNFLNLMAAAAAAGALSACGGGSASSSAQPSASAGTETVKEALENAGDYVPTYPIVSEPITVTGLVLGADTSVSSSRLVWDRVSELTGINIEWINIDAESLATYIAGNDWPDFFHTDEFTSSQINDYGVLGGRFVNYLEHLDVMPNLVKTYEDYPVALATSTQLNGEVYSLFQVSGNPSTGAVARPHVRMDVLNAAGITEMPTTVDELYDQLVILKQKNGTPGMVLDTRFNTGMVPMLFAAFGPLHNLNMDDDGTGKVVYSRVTDQMKYYYTYLHKLYAEELMNREFMTLDTTALDQLAKSGTVAYPTGSSTQKLSKEDLGGSWDNLKVLAPLTSEYDSTQSLAGFIDYRPVCGMYINKDSKYVEELCKMFDIAFATEEVADGTGLLGQTFTWGFEGSDWVLNSDGTYDQTAPEPFKTFSEYQEQLLRWKDFGRADAFGAAITSVENNLQARQKGYVENVIPYQITEHVFPSDPQGILKFTDDEQYVIDNKYADISLYTTEMEAKFISGAADIDSEWDNYINTCEKMGLSDVLEVYQASYDRWCASMTVLD